MSGSNISKVTIPRRVKVIPSSYSTRTKNDRSIMTYLYLLSNIIICLPMISIYLHFFFVKLSGRNIPQEVRQFSHFKLRRQNGRRSGRNKPQYLFPVFAERILESVRQSHVASATNILTEVGLLARHL